jgi:hypothetical protein
MSCDNSTYCSANVGLAPSSSLTLEVGDYVTARETDLQAYKSVKQGPPGLTADQSKSKRHRHEVQSRFIPDTTQINPEYVWGDEGPIND